MPTVFVSIKNGGLCNNLKNLISATRLAKEENGFIITKDNYFKPILMNYNSKINVKKYKKQIFKAPYLIVFERDNCDPELTHTWEERYKDKYVRIKNARFDIGFENFPESLKNDYFNIVKNIEIRPHILETVNKFVDTFFNKNTVSVHLRSWFSDHWHIYKKTDTNTHRNKHYFNIDSFINNMSKYNGSNFFVATDHKKYIPILKNKFPNRIITYDDTKYSQLEKDFIDLLLLSKNAIILGSYMSSFSEMAWWFSLGKAKLIISSM